jgi:hypothetical protein
MLERVQTIPSAVGDTDTSVIVTAAADGTGGGP